MEFKIPPLPTTLGEILQVLSREAPVPDDRRLVAIIEKDPAISIYVLRQVNSAYYGLRRRVTEIQRAVALLGLKRVCNLVLAAALKQTFAYLEDPASQTIYAHVIQTSVATAAFARDLAAHLRLPMAETAFTAGLLHQLGRLVFLYSVPHLYVPLWYENAPLPKPAPPRAPSCQAERICFNTDYLTLGASTLCVWKLPDEFALITNHLHAPDAMDPGPLHTLTLAVAAGHTASDALFAPAPSNPHDVAVSPCLAALARAQHADAQAMARFLNQRSEPVSQFARSVLNDA